MTWFLDFVGFQFPATGFIVKEIAILNSAGSRCYNYFITGPKPLIVDTHNIYNFQYGMHNLQWEWGDYEFDEVMQDIERKLGCDTVYVKGGEKYDFINRLLQSVTLIELEHVPAFKYLNSCMHERCEVKHGNHCARRKVYELKNALEKQGLSR